MAKKILRKKLFRDMRHAGMQFAALIMLCVLGTFLYAGIDGIARMVGFTNQQYFKENQLADLWVTLPAADRGALTDIRALPEVEAACARFSVNMECLLPTEPTLNVTAYEGSMDVNIPTIIQGEALDKKDRRGCLIQAGFAEENGVKVGDNLTVRFQEVEYPLTVRGIAYSPEFIAVTDDFAANLQEYGFILVNAEAFSSVPLNQIVVRLKEGADGNAVREAILSMQPKAFLLDRKTHRSTTTAQDNVTMFHSLSIVFPMAAFLVAALIVTTTLTRMIDNQRMQIGTLRALGYEDRTIRAHYLCYALLPSLVGSVGGAVLGHLSLPPLVWDLLISQYEYPYTVHPPISPSAWGMVVISVAGALLICIITFQKAARETAAELLRPKPPKAGKRVLLERLPAVWGRMSFNAKMVMRNILRVKIRTLISCVGIMSCCALLIASIGLQESVQTTVYNLYGGTLRYDLRVRLNDQAGSAEAYEGRLQAERVECVMETSVDIAFGPESRVSLLTVLEDNQELMYLGKQETYVRLETGTAAVTDKLARLLGAKEGDRLSFLIPGEDEAFEITIGQLVYNNFSQGVYLNRSTWEGLRKGPFTPSAILLKNPGDQCLARLKGMEEVKQVDGIESQGAEALVSMNSVSSIFYILGVIALALAFVICYNIGLINFSERVREYATLKVLGYHQREIRRIILWENILVALLGLVLSIVPGIVLTDMILAVCETDSIRYASHITPFAIGISCLVTFGFSIVIQLVLVRKVRSIVMVEALKSVE